MALRVLSNSETILSPSLIWSSVSSGVLREVLENFLYYKWDHGWAFNLPLQTGVDSLGWSGNTVEISSRKLEKSPDSNLSGAWPKSVTGICTDSPHPTNSWSPTHRTLPALHPYTQASLHLPPDLCAWQPTPLCRLPLKNAHGQWHVQSLFSTNSVDQSASLALSPVWI